MSRVCEWGTTWAAVAAGVLVAACAAQRSSGGGGAGELPSNREARERVELVPGDYACSFHLDDDDIQYEAFHCVIFRDENGLLRLEKRSGSQRLRGVIHETPDGFAIEGLFFCPYGDCDEDFSASFVAEDDGRFRGKMNLEDGRRSMTLEYLPAGYLASAGGYGYGAYGIGYGYGYGYGYGSGDPLRSF